MQGKELRREGKKYGGTENEMMGEKRGAREGEVERGQEKDGA